eukprot:14709395-Alexandrium_andersonii.AAC.1
MCVRTGPRPRIPEQFEVKGKMPPAVPPAMLRTMPSMAVAVVVVVVVIVVVVVDVVGGRR